MIYIIVLAIIAMFGPHLWARYVLNRYNRREYFSGSGIDLARLVLERLDLSSGVPPEADQVSATEVDPLCRSRS